MISSRTQDNDYIYLSMDIPFKIDYNEVIYIETKYNIVVNNYIIENKNHIVDQLTDSGLNFSYIPDIKYKIHNQVQFQYYFPNGDFSQDKDNEAKFDSSSILKYLKSTRDNYLCGFIKYDCVYNNMHRFHYYEIKELSTKYVDGIIKEITSSIGDELFSSIIDSKFDIEEDFCDQAKYIAEDIKENIEKLRIMGISEMAIKSLFKTKQTISRLLITKEYKIILLDYNNLEIYQSPLPKALFILFLKHPEGILLKELINYRSELLEIYLNISNKEDINYIKKSISDITDPSKNSINEKCSRIKASFLSKIDESLSVNYYITGKCGKRKKITLNRDLLFFEE